MLNFNEGQINLVGKNISITSNRAELVALAQEGLVEERSDAGGIYYYAEAEADGMRLGVFISGAKQWQLLLDRSLTKDDGWKNFLFEGTRTVLQP